MGEARKARRSEIVLVFLAWALVILGIVARDWWLFAPGALLLHLDAAGEWS